jgi:hypothetical protein
VLLIDQPEVSEEMPVDIKKIISETIFTTTSGVQKDIIAYESKQRGVDDSLIYKLVLADIPLSATSKYVVLEQWNEPGLVFSGYSVQLSPKKNYILATLADLAGAGDGYFQFTIYDESGRKITGVDSNQKLFSDAFPAELLSGLRGAHIDFWIDEDTYQVRMIDDFSAYVNTFDVPSLKVATPKKITVNGLISEETALKFVRYFPSVAKFLSVVPDGIVEIDSTTEEIYRIHVYETKSGTIVTQGWYLVFRSSGTVLEDKPDMGLL